MKKIIVLLMSIFAMNVFASNSETTMPPHTETAPMVCQFSLNHYTGTINSSGETQGIRVQLNCPQSQEVAATVFVYIQGELIASKVFQISAGAMRSVWDSIQVGANYSGMKYTLKVE